MNPFTYIRRRLLIAPLVVFALAFVACGSPPEQRPQEQASARGGPDSDGPPIVVGSFNFPESVVLAEIYARALESHGFPVQRRFDLGSRELILPELTSGELDLLPEYLGSGLSVGFGGDATSDVEETLERYRSALRDTGLVALEPAPGSNTNVFAATQQYADEHGLASISDLAGVPGPVVFGAPPECEDRDTCLRGLVETYGLDDIHFEVLQEGSTRIASLEQGRIDLALLFSTQPVIAERGFVVLEDDRGIIPVENIVPVINAETLDAHGEDLRRLIDSITERITTDVLMELNRSVEVEAMAPRDVARAWLENEGFIE